jgi:hypothetical protein
MAESTERVFWEQVTQDWWNSPIGYVSFKDGVWTAYVYRNVRIGQAWTESKTGFRTAARAMQWVENEARS